MFRFLLALLLLTTIQCGTITAQPRFKGKRLDTTQGVLGTDSDITKLVKFKDSVASVGPETSTLREEEPREQTGMILLILAMLTLIAWAGRRAWRRQHKK